MKRLLIITLVACGVATPSGPPLARTYAAKPVRIIVPYAPGANADLIAQRLSPVGGQQALLYNRPGDATNIGSAYAAKAPPDGYMLLPMGLPNAIHIPAQRNCEVHQSHQRCGYHRGVGSTVAAELFETPQVQFY